MAESCPQQSASPTSYRPILKAACCGQLSRGYRRSTATKQAFLPTVLAEEAFKEAVQADAEEFAFEEDQKYANVVYEARTLVMREDLPKKIEILEKRLVAIYNPHKEAEQDGTGQPATRSQSKSKGSDKPQLEAEGRSR
jgi:hypothetical protein